MSEGSTQEHARSISWPHVLLLLGIAALAWSIDFFSKEWILANFQERESREVLGEALRFTFVRNPGAAFSFASGATWIFTILSASVAVAIVIFARRLRSAGWALVLGGLLGGTTGNLFDRLTREPGNFQGHVIDFIHVWGFPAIFNVADIAICVSMGGLILLVLRGTGVDGSHPVTDEPAADEPMGGEPVGDEPVGDEPGEAIEPAGDESAADELAADDPAERATLHPAPRASELHKPSADKPAGE